MVTTPSLVDDYVLIAVSLIGTLVICCFDISPGELSSFVKLVSLCVFSTFSYVFFLKFAIRDYPNKPNVFVSF